MDYSDTDAFHTFMDLNSHQADHVLDSVSRLLHAEVLGTIINTSVFFII